MKYASLLHSALPFRGGGGGLGKGGGEPFCGFEFSRKITLAHNHHLSLPITEKNENLS